MVLVFVWFPVNFILTTFNLEEFSPTSLAQAVPTLLRQTWSESEADPQDTMSRDEIEALSAQAANFMSVLSGAKPQRVARENPEFLSHDEEFEDFSLVRVVLGYGIPTLLAVGLALLVFCMRDL